MFSLPAGSANLTMRSATSWGYSTTLVECVTTPADDHSVGQRHVPPDLPVVPLPRVGRLEQVRADVDSEQDVDDIGHREIGGVAVIVTAFLSPGTAPG